MATRLIKSVANELKTSHPSISTLSTLSPIPDFKNWLKQFLEVVIITYENVYVYKKFMYIYIYQYMIIYIYMYLSLSILSTMCPIPHRGINADHGINVNRVFALVSLFWVLIYINSMIYINSSVRFLTSKTGWNNFQRYLRVYIRIHTHINTFICICEHVYIFLHVFILQPSIWTMIIIPPKVKTLFVLIYTNKWILDILDCMITSSLYDHLISVIYMYIYFYVLIDVYIYKYVYV
jgi:hypothetical protein